MAASDKEKIDKTIKDLDDLQKSQGPTELDGIELLEKALAEFDDLDPLNKAEEDDDKGDGKDADDKGDKDDATDKGDDDKGDKGDDTDKGAEPVQKSISEEDLAEELVKASLAYAELEASVELMTKSHSEQIGALSGQVGDLCEAVAGLTHLMQATGRGIVTLNKSVREGMETIGGLPARGNEPIIGNRRPEDLLQKSKSEVCGLIKTALNEGTLLESEAIWLSKAAVHGEFCLPEEVKRKIGLI